MAISLGCLAVLLAAFLYREHAIKQERDKWTAERRELLNRIKPETAVMPTTIPEIPDPVLVKSGPFGDWDRLEEAQRGDDG